MLPVSRGNTAAPFAATQAPAQTPLSTSRETSSTAAQDPIAEIVAASKAAPVQSALEIGTDPTVPLFDFEKICGMLPADRAEAIEEFGEALRNVGFLGLKIPAALQARVNEANKEIRRYFGQDIQTKMQDWRDNGGQTGFSQFGRESAAGIKAADLKETYFIPPNFTDWPKDQPTFEAVMKAYHVELSAVAGQVMEWLLEYLNVPSDSIRDEVASADGNLIRLAHYFAPKEGDDPTAVWAAEHKDLNCLTLLPRPSGPGLQLLTRDGKWKDVVVPEGYLIVNTGEQLEHLTGGMINATPHQVVNPGGEWARRERFATIFFASFPEGKVLTPISECVDFGIKEMGFKPEEVAKNYPAGVTVQEARLSRLIEMGTIKDPGEETVRSLREKGMLRKPPEALKTLYPHLLGTA